MRGREESKVFRSFLLLHRPDFGPRAVPMRQSVRHVHQTRVEGVFDVLAAGHRRFAAVPHLRGAFVRRFHHHHARNAAKRHLERRNWN